MTIFKRSFWTEIHRRYVHQLSDTKFHHSTLIGFLLLVFSILVNYFASLYALERASSPVEDLILSNIPVYNVDWIFMWGPLIFWIILSLSCLTNPKRIPLTLKSIALFILIRSIFISLTHIGPFPDHVSLDEYTVYWVASLFHVDPRFSFVFSSGADLFFSAHTGLPFLMALVYWKDELVRIFCILSSIFFAIIVLMGHLHYSIDVLSAFFITYTINSIANYTFRLDKERFHEVDHVQLAQ